MFVKREMCESTENIQKTVFAKMAKNVPEFGKRKKLHKF